MHLIRRSAFRAVTSPSASFLFKSHSITPSSSFINGTKLQLTLSPISRRFASNDVESDELHSETESTPSSSNGEDRSSIQSTISSASGSVSNYASDVAESLSKTAATAKDAVVDTASGIVSAARLANTARGQYRPTNFSGESKLSDTPKSPDDDQTRSPGRSGAPLQPNNGIYIGNFTFETTEADLEREFGPFGKIEEITIAKDHRNLSKGFGYVRFSSIDAATAAIQEKDQTVMDGRRVVVNYQLKNYRPAGTNPPGKTLFIGNLAFEMSDADLNALFRDIENVMDVRVAIDRRTGQPRGFAHADFMDAESAMKGLEALKGKEYYGRVLRVDYAGPDKRSDPVPSGRRSEY